MLADLDAGLESRGFDACDARTAGAGGAIARVELIASSTIAVLIRAEVFTAVRSKDLERDVSLERVTDDGRALAIAVSIDELVRAGLDELSMARRAWVRPAPAPAEKKPEEKPQPTPEVKARIEVPAEEVISEEPAELARVEESSPARILAGVRAHYESFGGGLAHFGGELYLRWLPLEMVALELSGGPRTRETTALANGTISARALSFAVTPSFIVVPFEDGLEVSLAAGVRGLWLEYRGNATVLGATAHAGSGLALYAEGGLNLALALFARMRLELRVCAGAPLRSFTAREGERVATGASGIELSGSTGLAWGF